jgi:hypothetical protein
MAQKAERIISETSIKENLDVDNFTVLVDKATKMEIAQCISNNINTIERILR